MKIFYAGRNHINRKSDRDELITMIKNNFPDFNDRYMDMKDRKNTLHLKIMLPVSQHHICHFHLPAKHGIHVGMQK